MLIQSVILKKTKKKKESECLTDKAIEQSGASNFQGTILGVSTPNIHINVINKYHW